MSSPSDQSHRPTLTGLSGQLARDCLALLDKPEALADEALVHQLRVATKRLRAAWRLVGELAGRGPEKQRRRALRSLSAPLSGTRDLSVLTALAQHLAAQEEVRSTRALGLVVTALLKRRESAPLGSCPSPGFLDELRAGWTAEADAWESLGEADPHDLRHAIRRELRRSRHRARRDTREAMRSLDPGLWHDWRKTVKRLRYQREFIALVQDRRLGKFDARIHRLGSRLGERNDLANLAKFAGTLQETGDLSSAEHGYVRQAIAAREAKIVGNCRRLGRLAFLR